MSETRMVRVGYQVPGGDEVLVPFQHIAIYGLTQQAGKTTLLEGLISRAGGTVLVLRTGRNEIPFASAHRSRPFFRERYDWRYVEGLLWTFLQERPKIYRTWVMRATQGARSLADVHQKILSAAKKATRGWDQDLLFQLDHYFAEILPGLERLRFGSTLELYPGAVNVMDLESTSSAVQQLVVGAVLDHLLSQPPKGGCIVVLPEARDFLPSDRSTPAKLAADQFVRRGAKLQLYLWLDSQSLTGVDQQIVRNFGLSLHGRQTSDLEIKRIVKAADHGLRPKDVKNLGLGQFLLEDRNGVRRVYAQPAWMTELTAREVARGTLRPDNFHAPDRESENGEENEMEREEREAKDQEIAMLREQLRVASMSRDVERDRAERNARLVAELQVERIKEVPSLSELAGSSRTREAERATGDDTGSGQGRRTKADVHVFTETPSLTLHVREVRRDATAEEPAGRAALLVAQGFFDQRRSVNEACAEFREHGWGEWKGGSGWNNMDRMLNKLAGEGFLRNVDKGYVVVPEARARIHVVKESA
jgi:hypothetical protein